MNWQEVCEDKSLADLPYKIELNRWGQIVMSPADYQHSSFQGEIIRWLNQLMPHGRAIPECAVDTAENTKVPDVVWIPYVIPSLIFLSAIFLSLLSCPIQKRLPPVSIE